ncbi:hypothetical protein [Faecalibacter macacae]|uniref:Lipocalin-like domain-containing protein n=1 Tax=Faecalibacter macacae TaxID=1859289 RepID=A0A3L9MGY6_9FLAO|nr:hypothetical protein [Faecalibacter macacae]RLZ12330.1 hypothetical protein EAH69_02110 [Faecalibacter macacae]
MNQNLSKIIFLLLLICCQNIFAQNLELKAVKDNKGSRVSFKEVKSDSSSLDLNDLDAFDMENYRKQLINELDYEILQKNIIGKWKLISNVSITGEESSMYTISEMTFNSNNSWENISDKKHILRGNWEIKKEDFGNLLITLDNSQPLPFTKKMKKDWIKIHGIEVFNELFSEENRKKIQLLVQGITENKLVLVSFEPYENDNNEITNKLIYKTYIKVY